MEERKVNHYLQYFNENMTSNGAMFQYFSLLKEADKAGEKEELWDAYWPVQSKISRREIDKSYENGIIS